MNEAEKIPREAYLIANPTAGRGHGLARLIDLENAIRERGIETHRVLDPDSRAVIARKLRSESDTRRRVLVVIGGDGTVNALVNDGPTAPICHYASGTENLFSRAFGTPKNPEAMADWILGSRESSMDLGEFRVESTDGSVSQTKRFALMLGFGFDAAVVNRHHAKRVGRSSGTTSRLAYFGPLAHEAWHYDFPAVRMTWTDDSGESRSSEGTTAIVFNFDCYALGLKFAPGASPFDGNLDTVRFERRGSIRAGLYLAMVASGIHVKLKSVGLDRMREIRLEAVEKPVPVQMDGDPAGWLEPGHPWHVRCVPAVCPVLVGP
ncbi:diacylglycerol kinase [bacterium]|nr:diacylglycerol kinase [bacterium]